MLKVTELTLLVTLILKVTRAEVSADVELYALSLSCQCNRHMQLEQQTPDRVADTKTMQRILLGWVHCALLPCARPAP